MNREEAALLQRIFEFLNDLANGGELEDLESPADLAKEMTELFEDYI